MLLAKPDKSDGECTVKVFCRPSSWPCVVGNCHQLLLKCFDDEDESSRSVTARDMHMAAKQVNVTVLQGSRGTTCALKAAQLCGQAESQSKAQHLRQCFVAAAPVNFLRSRLLPLAFSWLAHRAPNVQTHALNLLSAGGSSVTTLFHVSRKLNRIWPKI